MSLACTSTHNDVDHLFRGANRQLAISLIELVNSFEAYWPMTLRGFYYQAVSHLLVPNNLREYRRISKILAELRRADLVPWFAMEDKTRTTSDKRGEENVEGYIQRDLDQFLHPKFYQRCYIQNQPVYVELSVEKDALSDHVKDAAWRYCTRVSVTRGQVSATMLNEMAERFDKAIMRGLQPILLHFGDLDPTGVQIPKSIKSGLLEHHGLDVDVRSIALKPEHCRQFSLPQSLDAAKAGDPNYRRWVAEYGNQSPTELDALHPEHLKALVRDALESIYDVGEIDEQQQREEQERELLATMRRKTILFLREAFPDYMREVAP